MKATHTDLPKSPEIKYTDQGIMVNQDIYHNPIIIHQDWQIKEQVSLTPTTWLDHPLRRTVTQILTWPELTPDMEILDLYWEQEIQIELLPLPAALQLIKIYQAENSDFQCVIFPKPIQRLDKTQADLK